MAYLDSEAVGADKGKEDSAYDGFGDRDDEESEDVEDDQAEVAGVAAGPAWAGGVASNKYIFRKVSQFVSLKCMYFRKLSQILFRRNTKRFASFYTWNMISQAFANFHTFSQIWFHSVSQYFARFRNL